MPSLRTRMAYDRIIAAGAAESAQASASAAAASAATANTRVTVVDERTTSARQFLALD